MRKENLEYLEHKEAEERCQNKEFCGIVCVMQERQFEQILRHTPHKPTINTRMQENNITRCQCERPPQDMHVGRCQLDT